MSERITQLLLGGVGVLLVATLLRPFVPAHLLQAQDHGPLAPPSSFAAADHNVYVMRGNVLSVYWVDPGITDPFAGMALLDPTKKEAFLSKMKKNAKVHLLIEQDLSELRPEK